MTRRILSGLTLLAVLLVAPSVFATGGGHGGNCNGYSNCDGDDNRTYNQGGKGGHGGDARSKAKSYSDADARSRSSAKAVDRSKTYNVNVPIAKGGSAKQGQGQDQGQAQGQGQKQGMEYNGNTEIGIEGDTVTYEAAASAFVGPDVNPDQIQVECPMYVQDGVSLGGGVVQGGGGVGWTNAETGKRLGPHLRAALEEL